MKRRTYTLTDKQLELVMKASQPVRYMVIGGRPPSSPQENANRAWQKVAKEHGVDWETIKPHPSGDTQMFTAIPLEEG